MTFESWWHDHLGKGNEQLSDYERDVARDAWNAALNEAARHFDGYTWGHYKNPALTIREMIESK